MTKLFVLSGQAKLVKGDALKKDNVRNAWTAAAAEGPVELASFTVSSPPPVSLMSSFCSQLLQVAQASSRSHRYPPPTTSTPTL